jgi:hypothetical protein
MEKRAIDTIPARIKYYILDWKDNNIDEFISMFGEKRLHELDKDSIINLFKHIVEQELLILNK